jgi:nifR3 family TIM-barrel protein
MPDGPHEPEAAVPWPAAASRGYRIDGVVVDPPVVMAPMEGVTDVHFLELLLRVGGPGLCVAEMASADGLVRGQRAEHRLLSRPRGCAAFAVQIYGHDAGAMARAAVLAADAGADVVDVNMGCPAKTITGRACGSSLLRDETHVARILEAVRAALPPGVPLTLKYRLGWDDATRNFVEIGRLAEACGVAALSLHGRTRAQLFRGEADWEAVARLKDSVSIPVVGNGDVRCAADVPRRLAESRCDGVMVARAALANPWVFRQVRQLLAGEPVTAPSPREWRHELLRHLEILREELGEGEALHRMRKLLGFCTKGLVSGIRLRQGLCDARDGGRLRALIEGFFDDLEAVAPAA